MAIEAGARVGLIAVDEQRLIMLKVVPNAPKRRTLGIICCCKAWKDPCFLIKTRNLDEVGCAENQERI